MASLSDTLIANGAQQLNKGVDVAGDLQEGVKAGIQLATAKEQIESAKVKLEEDKEKLAQGKFQSFDSMMKTLNRAGNPAIAKQLAKGMKNRFQQMGFDPSIVDIVISDPEFGRTYQNISDLYTGKIMNDPKALAKALQSTQDAGLFSEGLIGLKDSVHRQHEMDKQNDQQESNERIARERVNQEKKVTEKLLTATETSQLGDLKTQLGSVDALYKDWEDKVGGIDNSAIGGTVDYVQNKAGSMIPNTELSKYDDNLKQKAQLIGKALEGGKLTDVDYTKYVKFLPQDGDTKERAKERIKNLRSEFTNAYNDKIKAFGEAGYKTSGFTDITNRSGGSDSKTPPNAAKARAALERARAAKSAKAGK